MTKQIRVENADTSSFRVRLYIEDLIDGSWIRTQPATELDYPTCLATAYLTSTRRVVVEECE